MSNDAYFGYTFNQCLFVNGTVHPKAIFIKPHLYNFLCVEILHLKGLHFKLHFPDPNSTQSICALCMILRIKRGYSMFPVLQELYF